MKRKTALIPLIIALSSCATSPMGRSQFIIVSDDKLAERAAEGFGTIKSKVPQVKDPATTQYVMCVVKALIQSNQIPGRWEVRVFDTPKEVNAFAMPGGKIGVLSGILKEANTPDKLAAVLGHEIAHVTSHHAAEQASISGIIGTALGLSGLSGLAAVGASLGANLGVLMPFSRTHEAEADKLGLIYMTRAGFNPHAAVSFWQAMAAKEKAPEFMALLSTHPGSQTRSQDLEAMIHTLSGIQPNPRPNCRAPL